MSLFLSTGLNVGVQLTAVCVEGGLRTSQKTNKKHLASDTSEEV